MLCINLHYHTLLLSLCSYAQIKLYLPFIFCVASESDVKNRSVLIVIEKCTDTLAVT